MTIPVYILATCRAKELLPYTELVFKTLRIGFPDARVTVFMNNLQDEPAIMIARHCKENDCCAVEVDTIHHDWVRGLCEKETSPFWILDTDVHFFEQITEDFSGQALAGWRIPEFRDEFSGCITRARLHTSLLYIDPKRALEGWNKIRSRIPPLVFTPLADAFNPIVVVFKGEPYFYDTCAMLYHAVGGASFKDSTKEKYWHMNFGTIPDLVLPRLSNGNQMMEARAALIANPVLGKGVWRFQEQYYSQRPV